MSNLDHLYLAESHRLLIADACGKVSRIFLAPLDKGLSGSSVWLAQWRLRSGQLSKPHVFKIGPAEKLKREYVAVENIASVLENGFPQMNIYLHPDKKLKLALLRQQFAGSPEGRIKSLRQFIRNDCLDPDQVREVVQRLYFKRMAVWHVENGTPGRGKPFRSRTMSISKALDWWVGRTNIDRDAKDLGYAALDRSLQKHFSLTVVDLEDAVTRIGRQQGQFVIGPIHGDLHAQNVLVDETKELNLIDFGWTSEKWRAVDFLMMECSLKFLVLPANIRLEDFLTLEKKVDGQWAKRNIISCKTLSHYMLGNELIKIGVGVCTVRDAAVKLRAISNPTQYRQGLILLTAGLASVPGINRIFLFHSLAYQISQLDTL